MISSHALPIHALDGLFTAWLQDLQPSDNVRAYHVCCRGGRVREGPPRVGVTRKRHVHNTLEEAIAMDRVRKVVYGTLAVLAAGAVMAMASGIAMAQDTGSNGTGTATGGADLNPAYQVGNAQGDGSGK
jgi:hypothetical protein